MHRLTLDSGQRMETILPERVSAFAFRRGGGFIFAAGRSIYRASVTGKVSELFVEAQLAEDERFNDGVADPEGRFWVGTLNAARRHDNTLFRISAGGLRVMDTGIGASNGMTWCPKGQRMYFADSPRKMIYVYHFDSATGAIGGRSVFVDTSHEAGVPDGLAMDEEGGVWCAYWDGWRVVRYDPSGRETHRIAIPTPRPTACTFGGSDLQTLYITSASENVTAPDGLATAGNLFRIETDFRGTLPNLCNL